MKEVPITHFGLLIAFVVPGLTAVWAASYFSETLRLWLNGSPTSAPTVGGFLYITIVSVAAGVTVSAVRWAFVDTLHHHSGIPPPNWDFSRLQEKVHAYTVLQENHYRFYQFYSNLLVSLIFLYVARRFAFGWFLPFGWIDVGVLMLGAVLFLGSRDTLRKFYARGSQLLGQNDRQLSESNNNWNTESEQCNLSPAARTRNLGPLPEIRMHRRHGGRHAEGQSPTAPSGQAENRRPRFGGTRGD